MSTSYELSAEQPEPLSETEGMRSIDLNDPAQYGECWKLAISYARNITNHQDAEDAAQRVMLGCWGTQPGEVSVGYVYVAVQHAVIDQKRKPSSNAEVLYEDPQDHVSTDRMPLQPDPAESVRSRETIRRIGECATLTDIQTIALHLHIVEGKSSQEIAAIMGCSDNVASARLYRARQKFRAAFDKVELEDIQAERQF